LRVLKSRSNIPEPMFDLLVDVKELFSGFRHVLVIKDSLKVHCSCYNDLEHSFDTNHDICIGTGWIPTIENHKAWFQVAGVPQSLPRILDLVEPAITGINAKFFYFFRNAIVNVGDEIVIAQFDNNGLPMLDTAEFYVVNHSEPKYDEQGRLIFHKISSERNTVGAQKRSLNLFNQKGIIKDIPLI
jgi:hypothetical protein